MKFADVKIGAEYLTKISGALVKVRTEGMREEIGYGLVKGKSKFFEVVRCDGGFGGRKLVRSAAQLRALS